MPTAVCLRVNSAPFAIVERYYNAANREPTVGSVLTVNTVQGFTDNFLDLVRQLDRLQQANVVIVTHGNDKGWALHFTPTAPRTANTSVLDNVKSVVAGSSFFRDIILKDTACTEAELDEMIAKINNIRGHLASSMELHIRGCEIGADKANLDMIRELFQAKVVTGPNCAMMYSSFTPSVGIDDYKKKHPTDPARREFSVGGGVVLDANKAGASASADGAVSAISDVAAFARLVYAGGGTIAAPAATMPIAAMWTGKPWLPHEPDYASKLVESK